MVWVVWVERLVQTLMAQLVLPAQAMAAAGLLLQLHQDLSRILEEMVVQGLLPLGTRLLQLPQ
jgi:hypothetical protein